MTAIFTLHRPPTEAANTAERFDRERTTA